MKQRQTRQKKIILDALQTLCHPTATEVYRRTHEEYPNVSRATVFRVLRQAEANGTVRRLALSGGEDRFDGIVRPHYHIRCRLCGRIDDVDLPYAEGLENRLTDDRGYAVESHEVIFQGVCPACRAAKTSVPALTEEKE